MYDAIEHLFKFYNQASEVAVLHARIQVLEVHHGWPPTVVDDMLPERARQYLNAHDEYSRAQAEQQRRLQSQ